MFARLRDENMLDMISICYFILLERKYGTELEHYDEKKNDYSLKKCIKVNEDCLELMKSIQKLLLESIKIQNKTEDQFEKLKECKCDFDKYLAYMNRLSEVLEIVVTPKGK